MLGFDHLWSTLLPLGRRSDTGGYARHLGNQADRLTREWFTSSASQLGLTVETDRNGNQWAWWGDRGADAVVLGSHLDSVPSGGAFDGPLGVVSALAAVERVRHRGVVPRRPVAVVAFAEEEGGAYGRACLGSGLSTGAIAPENARLLRDRRGLGLEAGLAGINVDPAEIGPDPERLRDIGLFLELHIEQGNQQTERRAPLALGSRIWPHGRWRLDFHGEANHAGTTALRFRRDPMVAYAGTVLTARTLMAQSSQARLTFGRVAVTPNATNAVASSVSAWLDARHAAEEAATELVDDLFAAARVLGHQEGVEVRLTRESWSGAVEFDQALQGRLQGLLGGLPLVPSGAGHDAGVLAGFCPTAMLFVRNPTGISHSPAENAHPDDCAAGVDALTEVLNALIADPTSGPPRRP